jgi:hypothetical protein
MNKRFSKIHELVQMVVAHANSDECLNWTGAKKRDIGYGRLSWKGIWMQTHRLSFELFVGPIPDHLWVLHKCDNSMCINPKHLYLGTHKDNMLDARMNGSMAGHRNGNSKLTTPQVIEMYRLRKTTTMRLDDIGALFGVNGNTVSRICHKKRWAHLWK